MARVFYGIGDESTGLLELEESARTPEGEAELDAIEARMSGKQKAIGVACDWCGKVDCQCHEDKATKGRCAFCPEQATSITCHAQDGRPCCYDCARMCDACPGDYEDGVRTSIGGGPRAPSDEKCVDCVQAGR